MAHQCIKYRLTAQGTVPDFLYLGEDGVGGVYVVTAGDEPPPRDLVMVGISKDGETGDAEIVESQQALQDYLTQVGTDWVTPSGNPEAPSVPFDAAAAAAYVWGRLDALNGA